MFEKLKDKSPKDKLKDSLVSATKGSSVAMVLSFLMAFVAIAKALTVEGLVLSNLFWITAFSFICIGLLVNIQSIVLRTRYDLLSIA